MAPYLSDNVVMAFPGFVGYLEGRQALIDSFAAFAREATVQEYREGAARIDLSQTVAVAQCPFEMVYERSGERWRSKGWDVWVFERRGARWLGVWRTMQGLVEEPVSAENE
jgi:hypothetical protein